MRLTSDFQGTLAIARKTRHAKNNFSRNAIGEAVLKWPTAVILSLVGLSITVQAGTAPSNVASGSGWPKELVDRAQARLQQGLCVKDTAGFDFSRYCQEINYRVQKKREGVTFQQPTPSRLVLSENKRQIELSWQAGSQGRQVSLNGRVLDLRGLSSVPAIHREILASRKIQTSGWQGMLLKQMLPSAVAGVQRISEIEVLAGEILADLKTYQGCDLLLNLAQSCEGKVAQIKKLSQAQQAGQSSERRKEIAREMKLVASEFNEKIYQEIMPTDVVRGCLIQADQSGFEAVASQSQKSLVTCSRELDRISDQLQSPEDKMWRQWFRDRFGVGENSDSSRGNPAGENQTSDSQAEGGTQ